MKSLRFVLIIVALGLAFLVYRGTMRRHASAAVQTLKGKATVEERLRQFGGEARGRLVPDFERIGLPYPPTRIVLVGLKQEKRLEVWISGDASPLKHLKSYPILGASGTLGPKLREGDRQVPEGVYRIESLNPNSLYHVALAVDYPNAFDKAKAKLDGRAELGGDIMIHGKTASIGCLAMGDVAAEELFVLVAESDLRAVSVIFSPVDFRVCDLPPDMPQGPAWTPELYTTIKTALSQVSQGKYP